jgi:immune inhibitor A
LVLKYWGKNPFERHLHPSIYEKIRKTEILLRNNVNPKDFVSKGGLDLETYEALQYKWQDHKKQMEENKQKVINTYGSLKNAPLSVGPCKRHEPVIGNKNALVLLTEFKDKKYTHKPEEFKELLFSKGSNLSMRDYYLEASWNQLDINGYVNEEWYVTKDNYFEYVDENPKGHYFPKVQKLVKETILHAKNSGKIDFSPHAKDGKIEILIVVFAGYGMDTKLNKNYIIPHKDQLSSPIEVQKGIWADQYCVIPEFPFNDLGCFCHEVGHFLGLPDLYREGYSIIVGNWCLMGGGCYNNEGKTPAHPSAWCKIHLGWTEPILLNHIPKSQEIPAVIDSKVIYKLEVPGSEGKEYFLLENRQQKGFDKDLPSNGLLIWHIDENACIFQAPNSDPERFFLTLEQSDGKKDLELNRVELFKQEIIDELPKEVVGDLGDPFPGITLNRTFDDESSPSSRTYNGKKSFVKVKSISDSGDLMNAQIGIDIHSNNIVAVNGRIPAKTPSKGDKTQKLINLYFLSLLLSSQKSKNKNSYDEGYQDGVNDCIVKIKENMCLNLYQDGYRRGYRQGYEKILRKFSKKSK